MRMLLGAARAALAALAAGAALGALCGCGATSAPPLPQHREELPPPAQSRIVRDTITVDNDHACVIVASGRVACWGYTTAGTLATTPVEVPGLDGAIGVAAARDSTCAWTTNGRVFCWRGDARGEFIAGLDDIVQVTATCGLHATGVISCWSLPKGPLQDIAGITDAVEIAGEYAGGAMLLCARTRAGAVSCLSSHEAAEPIPGIAGATSLGGAGARYAVLLPGHRLATWVGWTGRPMPQIVENIDAERVIVGGHLNAPGESLCVIGAQPRCWSWGNEPTLELTDVAPPPPNTRDLAMDSEARCARVADRVVCKGRIGRLGDGTSEYPDDFVTVDGVAPVRQLDSIGRSMCALRENGHISCWGDHLRDIESEKHAPIDRVPVELPGVDDAVEIALEGTDRGDGTIGSMTAVCARRQRGATCWTMRNGKLVASDAPQLAGVARLYSGPAVCGVSATNDVRCLRFAESNGSIPGFSEQDYDTYIYRGNGATNVPRVLGQRLRAALLAKRVAEGFHTAATSDPIGPVDTAFKPPLGKLTDIVEQRRMAWTILGETERVKGALCVRRRGGAVACWGERDYLGANMHSVRTDFVTVRGIR